MARVVEIEDAAYGTEKRRVRLGKWEKRALDFSLQQSDQWYDLRITDQAHVWRLAGHVETGHLSKTDPANVAPVLRV